MSSRGWGLVRALSLLLVVALVAPVDPVVLVGLPLAVVLLAFQRDDTLALALAALLVLLSFATATGDRSPVWYAERAWALMLGGGFVAASVLWREKGVFARALSAVLLAAAGVGLFAALQPSLLAELDWWMGQELSYAAGTAYRWIARLGAPGAPLAEEFGSAVYGAADWQSVLYPGFLALASLSALSAAWYLAVRLAGQEGGLAPLREFRFRDELVWILVSGLLLWALPVGETLTRLAENAMVFMGGLYLLRGLGVLVWVAASAVTSAWAAVLWSAAAVVLYPLLLGGALLVGLSDTWLDLRSRLGALSSSAGEGE